MSSTSAFILDSIFFSLPDLKILQGVYLRFEPGEICALTGENGAGKSTLMKIAAGQIRPDSGLTIIDGERFDRRSPRHRFFKMSYLPQTSMLPKTMSVRQLLKAFKAGEDLIQDPLIMKLSAQKVDELSGGERRYLEIGLLLSLERRYVLLDEPFTGVEPLLIERIIEKLRREAARGRGILLTDHYDHYVKSVVTIGYRMKNRQCYLMKSEEELKIG